MTDDLHDLAGAYALAALDPDEVAVFEKHLRGCDRCQAEVADFSDQIARLPDIGGAVPPAGMRARVLDEIGHTTQLTPDEHASQQPTSTPTSAPMTDELAARRRRRTPGAVLGSVAAALVLVIGGALLFGLRDSTVGVDDVFAADDAVVTSLALTDDGSGGTFRVAWSADQQQVAVIGDGLIDPGSDRAIALWAIVDDAPELAGLFSVADGSVRDVIDLDSDPAAWGVTIEPAGGSAAPTTPILFYGEV